MSLIVYVLVVLACDMTLIGWELAATRPRPGDLLLFCALLAAAVICIEAMRRLGQPSGVSRDLLSAWSWSTSITSSGSTTVTAT